MMNVIMSNIIVILGVVMLSVIYWTECLSLYRILSSIVRTFFTENYDEILTAHYTWKVPEKGFKIN
jgi:hypothetical protein